MSVKKRKKRLIFIIIAILICIVILCITIIALVRNSNKETIDLSKEEKNISGYLEGKIIPQGISTFMREYTGNVKRDEFYEQLYSVSSYLPDLVSSLKESDDFEKFYDENYDDISKLIGVDNKDDFIDLANYLVENDISGNEFNYCLYEKGTVFNANEYSYFKMRFNYKDYGDIEFTVKLSNTKKKNISSLEIMPPQETPENF